MARQANYSGRCFEAAAKFSLDHPASLVVHAWVRNDPTDQPNYIAHGWIEMDGHVYDLTESRAPLDRTVFYAKYEVREEMMQRYTQLDAAKMMSSKRSYGPWDDDLFPIGMKEPLAFKEFKEFMKTFYRKGA